jgi:CRISPR/Cas system-associated endoribonuclease Cas2
MNTDNLIKTIKAEPLTRLKNTTYDCQLVEAVREDILKLIQKLDEMLAK